MHQLQKCLSKSMSLYKRAASDLKSISDDMINYENSRKAALKIKAKQAELDPSFRVVNMAGANSESKLVFNQYGHYKPTYLVNNHLNNYVNTILYLYRRKCGIESLWS